MPLVQLFKKYWYLVVLGALVFAGNNASGYMTTGGFITNYTTSSLGMDRTDVLLAVIGRVRTYQIGFIVLGVSVFLVFPMISTKSLGMLYLALLLFSVGLGLTYGPQSALYSEMFPASVRFSGVSVSYAIGAIIGGAFSPMIAKAIFDATGSTEMISLYLLIFVVIALVAVSLIRDRKGIDLSISNEAEQAHGALVFHK